MHACVVDCLSHKGCYKPEGKYCNGKEQCVNDKCVAAKPREWPCREQAPWGQQGEMKSLFCIEDLNSCACKNIFVSMNINT